MQQNFKDISSQEFLLTNGIGGYCSSTFSGANTRRYHGLLVASFNPPTDRKVMVSKIEETIIIGDEKIELSSNQYPGVIHPNGYNYLKSYSVNNNQATIQFGSDVFSVSKLISIVQNKNTTIVQYANTGNTTIDVHLNPMLVYKDYHSLFTQSNEFDFNCELSETNVLKVYAKYQSAPLFIHVSKGLWDIHKTWYKNFELAVEDERGFPFKEDAMNIGTLKTFLKPGEKISMVFSTEVEVSMKIVSPKLKLFTNNKKIPTFIKDLELSSRQFVVQRKSTNGSTIIAGYHWFTDWGRDTMIAMRGICIATNREQEAKSILQTFFKFLDKGMLPNRFPDYDEALEYNTIDATLWLFVALYEYHLVFNDTAFIESVLPKLQSIIHQHIAGTRYNIHITEEGFLYGGVEGQQLTWMDARVDGFVVTPRIGCAVEINLLWYNALKIYQFFTKLCFHKPNTTVNKLVKKFNDNFTTFFVNENGYLNDVVVPNVSIDTSIRPNQIYAASLPFSPLSKPQKIKVLQLVQKDLLTDFGLRTLHIDNIDFKPIYQGNTWQRDNAYHQGTVWPFLWGEWALAYLQVHQFTPANCLYVWQSSIKLQNHFYNHGCFNAIAEIFDGLNPSQGKGCVHQAWSVGMMLQVFLHPNFDYSLIADK